MKRRLVIVSCCLLVAVLSIGAWFVVRVADRRPPDAIKVRSVGSFGVSLLTHTNGYRYDFRVNTAGEGKLLLKATPRRAWNDPPDLDWRTVFLTYDAATDMLTEGTLDQWEALGGAECDGEPRFRTKGKKSLGVSRKNEFGYFDTKFDRIKTYGVAALQSQSDELKAIVVTRDKPLPPSSMFDLAGLGNPDDVSTKFFLEVYEVETGLRLGDPVLLPFTVQRSIDRVRMSCDGRFAIIGRWRLEEVCIVKLPPPYNDSH